MDDAERRSLFSLSGYKGNRPVVGSVTDNTFKIQKRRYSRNDFAGRFYGRFEPEVGGTRIEGYFDSPEWTRWFMRIWLGMAILLGVPVFIAAVIEAAKGAAREQGAWVGLIVPPSLILFGIFLPRFGRLLGQGDEQEILRHVKSILAARVDDGSSGRR
jgi:hypothetical protein